MPETLAEAPQTISETYSSFLKDSGRKDHGGGVPPVQEKAEEPKPAESAATQQPGEKSTPETSPAAEAAPKEQSGSEPPPKQDKFEQRKAKLQREIDDLVRQRETLKREVTEPAKPAAQPAASAEPAKPAAAAYDGKDPDDPEPDQTKYTDWQKFQDDRAAWVARNQFRQLQSKAEEKRNAEKAAKDAEQAAKDQQAAKVLYESDLLELEEIGESLADEAPDFKDLLAEVQKKPVLSYETAMVALHGGELGARVFYDLMANAGELEKIEKLPTPRDRTRALWAKGNAILESIREKAAQTQTEPAQPKRSSAPKPPTTLSGTGPAASREPGDYKSFIKQKYRVS